MSTCKIIGLAERWQLLKNGVPVMVCSSIEEAEDEYCKHDCDEIRKIPEDVQANLSLFI